MCMVSVFLWPPLISAAVLLHIVALIAPNAVNVFCVGFTAHDILKCCGAAALSGRNCVCECFRGSCCSWLNSCEVSWLTSMSVC